MKDLFMCLLNNSICFGKLIDAYFYDISKYAKISIQSKDAIYEISIMKRDEEKKDD